MDDLNTNTWLEQGKNWIKANRRELISGVIGIALMSAIWFLCFYLPTPTIENPPTTTKEASVTLTGKASPLTTIVAFNASGTAVLHVNTDAQGSFILSGLPTSEGETAYNIRAFDGGLRASFPLAISIKKDTTAPALSINPFDQSVVTGSETAISGKAEPGSIVTVNGVRAQVNADGTWTTTVALQPGKNAMTVSSTDPAGNTTTETQTIQYTPANPTSPTGTVSVSGTTTSVSPGSQPAPASSTSTGTAPTTAPSPAPAPAPASAPTPTPTPSPSPTPVPEPKPILSISANAWVSNPTPNSRATETVYIDVKDNYGRPITGAAVSASIYFSTGVQFFTFTSQGNGTYTASFKLNDKFAANYRVRVESVARYGGFSAFANTSFTGSNR